MGFLYLLKEVPTDRLRNWNSYNFISDDKLGPGDRTLLFFFRDISTINTLELKRHLLLASDRDEKYNRLNYNEDDFPVMFSNTPSPKLLFSKENILEFHKLTIAAFEGFAFTFLQLKKEYQKLVGGIDY